MNFPTERKSVTVWRFRFDLVIIPTDIVNRLGAIIVQSGRQFDESGDCFFSVSSVSIV